MLFPALLPAVYAPEPGREGVKEAYAALTAMPLLLLTRGLHLRYVLDDDGPIYPDARPQLGPFARLRGTAHLRFCPVCVDEPRDRFGISWWTRSANLPLVIACPAHRGPLLFAPLPVVRVASNCFSQSVFESTNPERTSCPVPCVRSSQIYPRDVPVLR